MADNATDDERRAYRERLLPMVGEWRAAGTRFAIFGVGPHTDFLFDLVPELDAPTLAGFIESRAAADDRRVVRGRPVRPIAWARQHADVVLCSSFNNEVDQLLLLDAAGVRGLLSHRPALIVANAATVVLPVEASYVLVPPEEDAEPWPDVGAVLDHERAAMRAMGTACLAFARELDFVPEHETDGRKPWWANPYFTGDDARCAYGLVRKHRPRRIVEIGSGVSTRFLTRALRVNGDGGRLTAIDPQPRTPLADLGAEHLTSSLQRTPLAVFDALEAGDIVFFDGSHLLLQGSDCAHFFLRVLPLLAPGVLVHVHDIFLPEAYPPSMWPLRYNEQHLVAALLLGGDNWRPVLAVHYLSRRGVLPRGGSSFWMERRHAAPPSAAR
jgi:hypothetical protein